MVHSRADLNKLINIHLIQNINHLKSVQCLYSPVIIASSKCIHFSEVVILVVLTARVFRFSLIISQLLAKAIPVRGAKL
ncbi:hypothetical protein ERD95_10155, partial [Enterobacteriaceae bacterium ML5]